MSAQFPPPHFKPSTHMRERARQLRRDATPSETLLWEALRGRRTAGLKWRRQHPLGQYVLDFYCHELRLGIEIDGSVHRHADQRLRDQEREAMVREWGIRLLHVTPSEVEHQLPKILQGLSRLGAKHRGS